VQEAIAVRLQPVVHRSGAATLPSFAIASSAAPPVFEAAPDNAILDPHLRDFTLRLVGGAWLPSLSLIEGSHALEKSCQAPRSLA
jgi:hypothetical protein